MNGDELAQMLARVPMFSALPAAELAFLAHKLRLHPFEAGQVLIREGEHDNHFFILLEGEAEVIKALDTPDERPLATRPPGTLFGEMSIFDPSGSHTASVRVCTAALAAEMTRQDFDELLHRRPELAYELVRQISRRLEDSENATILDLRAKNAQLTQAYLELKDAQAQLIEKERLDRELTIARQIQESILPEALPQPAGYEIAALSIPAREVGGDYYDVFKLKGGRLGLAVGDACDKGIPAALLINLTNSLVHVESARIAAPESILRLVNRHLCQMSRAGMYVSLLYAVLEEATGNLEYSRAGHPHPVVLGADLRPVEVGSKSGMPLGILADIHLDTQSVTLPPGGLLVMYSDGLNEAQHAGGAEFGVERLLAALPTLAALSAQEICRQVWEQVQKFCAGHPQSDDFTVIVVKRGR